MVVAQSGKNRSPRKFLGQVFINRDRCKGCGICVEFCPTHVLLMDKEMNAKGYYVPVAVDAEACTGCDLCGLYCPDFAIHGIRTPQKEQPKGVD